MRQSSMMGRGGGGTFAGWRSPAAPPAGPLVPTPLGRAVALMTGASMNQRLNANDFVLDVLSQGIRYTVGTHSLPS